MGDSPGSWRRFIRQDTALAAIALLAGTAGVLLAGQYLEKRASDKNAELESRYATVPVVVAAGDIAQGTALQPSNLAARRMPREYLPADAVPVEEVSGLVGTNTLIEVRRGTPVLTSAVQRSAASTTLAATLSSSERAVTIPVDEISSHAGGVRIGDHVDLFHARSVSGEAVLIPLLQNVQVLGTGPDLREGLGETGSSFRERSYATVTLRVATADAPRLLLAQQAGQIAMLLRAAGDAQHVQTRILRAQELMRQPGPAAPRAASGMELLVGGSGSPVPERSWLRAGERSQRGEST